MEKISAVCGCKLSSLHLEKFNVEEYRTIIKFLFLQGKVTKGEITQRGQFRVTAGLHMPQLSVGLLILKLAALSLGLPLSSLH